jgi:hypothetical protein
MSTFSKTPVSLQELQLALEWASGDPGGSSAAFVSRATGVVHWVSDELDLDEPVPDDIDDGTLYVQVPSKVDLDLGKNLALSFAKERMPSSFEQVYGFFHKRGAYAKFKDLLQRQDRLQDWYDYEARAMNDALRAWCEENELTLTA